MSKTVIVEGLVKTISGKTILDNISIALEEKSIAGLLGPNGAGKTTLLKILVGIYKPTSGRVLVKNLEPIDPRAKKLLGYCPQDPGLFEELNAWDNILFYARLHGLSEAEALSRGRELLEKLGLLDHARRPVGKYSGGMKKKLSLAISLLPDPEILILDEPTTGLDPGVRRLVWDIILRERDKDKSILVATHYMEEADYLSDKVYIIDRGRIIASGAPEELKKKYGPQSVIEIEYYMLTPGLLEELRSRYSGLVYRDNIIRVHSEDPDRDLPALASLSYEYKAAIKAMRVTKPTLEDVFLALTGRRLEEV